LKLTAKAELAFTSGTTVTVILFFTMQPMNAHGHVIRRKIEIPFYFTFFHPPFQLLRRADEKGEQNKIRSDIKTC